MLRVAEIAYSPIIALMVIATPTRLLIVGGRGTLRHGTTQAVVTLRPSGLPGDGFWLQFQSYANTQHIVQMYPSTSMHQLTDPLEGLRTKDMAWVKMKTNPPSPVDTERGCVRVCVCVYVFVK